jgi:MFS family permease
VALTFVVCIFGWPIITVLPAYTRLRLHLEGDAYGSLLSALGAGALGASLITATFGTTARRGAFLLFGVMVAGAGLLALGFAKSLWTSGPCCAAIGFGLILYLATGQSALQLAVPDRNRGRVMAWWAMTLSASAPLGHLVASEMVKEFGIEPVLFGMAAGTGAAAVALAVALGVHSASQRGGSTLLEQHPVDGVEPEVGEQRVPEDRVGLG